MTALGIVAIGRNEGERLRCCLESVLASGAAVVYVDSGSTDDSVAWARSRGVTVVALNLAEPFTAARARNAGFDKLLEGHPDLPFVQFVDGDCEVVPGWLERARQEMEARPDVAVVCGRRRERHPEATPYNRLCDMEWATPIGETTACGGDAMFRTAAYRAVGGFRASLVAGEEPELCVRLRAAGWKVVRVDAEMTRHDAAMTHFGQWWRRSVRAGHAYAEVSHLHRGGPVRIWDRETRSNWFWGLLLPLAMLASAPFTYGVSLLLALAYLVLGFRVYTACRRGGASPADAHHYAHFCMLGKFAQAQGQLRYFWGRLRSRPATLIEYKGPSASTQAPVAYLVNQYPHVSHSFIRRELAGLEAAGLSVKRFSVRRSGAALVDKADQAEQQRTSILLAGGPLALLGALLWTACTGPLPWLKALAQALGLGWRSRGGMLRHIVYLAEACVLVGRLRRSGARHLHAHFGTNAAAVTLLTHTLGGPPWSFTIHGPEEFDRPESLSLKEKIAQAAFVVAVSNYGRSQVFRWCEHQHWDKVHVVHCGVDAAFLEEGQPVPRTNRLVCVGRLCEQKGQLLLLEALQRLAAAGVSFEMVLAGDGPMRSVVERDIVRRGLVGKVQITGWISSEIVRQHILEARALVLPSFAEGLPVVIMEALALGRPVVSTYVAGIPELVENGVNGWLVPAGSVEDLTTVLREVLAVPVERLTEMGRAGAASVAARHDAAREAARLAHLFGPGTSAPQQFVGAGSVSDGEPVSSTRHDPGGVAAISRGLSEAIPPEMRM